MKNSSTCFINLSDLNTIREKLSALTADTPALFGRMSAQHMIEHLILVLTFSNGKNEQQLAYSPEKAQKIKAFTIGTNHELPQGFKSPVIPEEPLPLIHADLESAKQIFLSELQYFENYFNIYPDATPINPTTGPLDYDQWIIFHNKHITHHFKQFGLM